MSEIPRDRSENAFEDYKPAYDAQQATVEANRCLFCMDAPCIRACPTSIDIPGFIRKIATNNVRGSAKTILEANVLGMSCARACPVEVLCVGACVYNHMGVPAIQIGRLQRFSTDVAFEKGWEFFTAGPDTGKSVGLIGGGPASLAAAHRLRRFGHRVTIYEGREVLGGLNTTGIAPYKLRADRAATEVDWVLRIGGIQLKTGMRVPDQLGWDELLASHDALFVGLGLGPDTLMALPGGDLRGIEGAVAWIEKMKLGLVNLEGVKHALVIGGGNTAIDAVRELVGLRVPSVTMVYRGAEPNMSGYAHEWKAAKEQGAHAAWQTLPVAFEGDERGLTGVRVVSVDAAKKPIAGTERTIPADLVLLAIGQSKLSDLVAPLGLATQGGRIVTDASGRTSHPKVFAGGDCANGGKEVVNAVAEGRDAAVAIHQMLAGGV
jgi:dihydropyrimidine dehydrogenase (NAD+) subunit PreT